uniref:Uncharacterized protein n=1 Tax=Romanomermis culicivorax TaxID=13658 RepID=A0A915HR43_ROMCU
MFGLAKNSCPDLVNTKLNYLAQQFKEPEGQVMMITDCAQHLARSCEVITHGVHHLISQTI